MSGETRWSPGPWWVEADDDVSNDKEGRIVVVDVLDGPERRATAHLIAAAPALYSALLGLAPMTSNPCFCSDHWSDAHPGYDDHSPACETARAALALARGETAPKEDDHA